MASLGIYLHIPFCLSKCPYCDFYSLRFEKDCADAYAKSLLRAIPFSKSLAGSSQCVDSIYFGGGTPILLGERLLVILESLKEHFSLTSDCEITLESNPAAATLPLLCALRKGGFNRLSMGVQSADDAQLRKLGRLHNLAQAVESVEAAASAGFENISVDLMLGTPGQSLASVERFAEIFSALPVSHISGYLLQIEPGTPFAARHIERLCPDEEAGAALYLHTVKVLQAHGFEQYEISNFAKPGKESRHNLKYWNSEAYLGLGPAAHSYLGGKRFFFPADLERFLKAENPLSLLEAEESAGDFFEYAMLRLRLCAGLDLQECKKRFPKQDFSSLLFHAEILSRHGLVLCSGERVALTVAGFLVSNSVIIDLLQ